MGRHDNNKKKKRRKGRQPEAAGVKVHPLNNHVHSDVIIEFLNVRRE